jgi:hypothetical protein
MDKHDERAVAFYAEHCALSVMRGDDPVVADLAAEFRAVDESARAEEREGFAVNEGNTHECIVCLHAYTPQMGQSEDCQKCGCDGTPECAAAIREGGE